MATYWQLLGVPDPDRFNTLAVEPEPEIPESKGIIQTISERFSQGVETAGAGLSAGIGRRPEVIASDVADVNQFTPSADETSFRNELAARAKAFDDNPSMGSAVDIAAHLFKNPKQTAGEVAQSVGMSGPAIGGAVAGATAGSFIPGVGTAVGGIVGYLFGNLATNTQAEISQGLEQKLGERGVDTKNVDAISGALKADPDLLEETVTRGMKRGAATTGVESVVDLATVGLARTLKPITSTMQRVGRVGGAAVGQGVAEGAGSVAADVAVDEPPSYGQAVTEGIIGSIADAPVGIAGLRAGASLRDPVAAQIPALKPAPTFAPALAPIQEAVRAMPLTAGEVFQEIGKAETVDEAIVTAGRLVDESLATAADRPTDLNRMTDDVLGTARDYTLAQAQTAEEQIAAERGAVVDTLSQARQEALRREIRTAIDQRQASLPAEAQQVRDRDAAAMVDAARQDQLDQEQALTSAQGFDEPKPTAMNLAMQRARAVKQEPVLAPAVDTAVPDIPPFRTDEGQRGPGLAKGDSAALYGRGEASQALGMTGQFAGRRFVESPAGGAQLTARTVATQPITAVRPSVADATGNAPGAPPLTSAPQVMALAEDDPPAPDEGWRSIGRIATTKTAKEAAAALTPGVRVRTTTEGKNVIEGTVVESRTAVPGAVRIQWDKDAKRGVISTQSVWGLDYLSSKVQNSDTSRVDVDGRNMLAKSETPAQPASGSLSRVATAAPRAMRRPLSRSEQAVVRQQQEAVVDIEKDSLLTAIARLGGIDRDQAVALWGLDSGDLKSSSGIFGKPIFRKGGRSPDDLRQALESLGYLDADNQTDLENKIQDSLRGRPQYTARAQEIIAERESVENEAADRAEADAALANLTDEDINALLQEAGYETEQQTDTELDAIADDESTSRLAEADAEGERGSALGRGQAARDEAPEGFQLSQQTEAQARAESTRQEKERADRARRDAAPAPANFTLSGSDRAADEAESRGQRRLETDSSGVFPSLRGLKGEASWTQARTDAIEILGFDPGVLVRDEPGSQSVDVPMAYGLDDGVIYYDSDKPRSRGADVQYMIEEMLHAVDHVGGKNTISASSMGLAEGGTIRAEIESARQKSTMANEFFAYPLDDKRLGESRIKAELFARIGVFFHVEPDVLKAIAPKTYARYKLIFGDPASVSRQVRDRLSSSTNDAQVRSQSLDEQRVLRRSERSNQAGQAARLGNLRARIATAISGKREGATVDFGRGPARLETRKDRSSYLGDLTRDLNSDPTESDPANPDIRFSRVIPTPSRVRQEIANLLTTQRGFNWFHRTLGTQFHKAKVSPAFKTVFDAVQRHIGHVNTYANEAADLVPTIFPKIEKLRDVAKSRSPEKDLEQVSRALFDGTLADPDPAKGKVWTDEELRSQFKMTTAQITLYRESRAAIDKSLDDLGKAEMVREAGGVMSEQVMKARSVSEARTLLAGAGLDAETMEAIDQKVARIEGLKAGGYAPLMRFGQYSIYVTDANGEQVSFQMFDSEREANKAARQWPGMTVKQGVLPQEVYELFAGISPDTLEVFADAADIPQNAATQAFLKLARNQRSASKRLIHRKGTAGFSEDLPRVLASFITSNARAIAGALESKAMLQGVQDAKGSAPGDVADEAANLVKAVNNPFDPSAKIRGLMFVQYLGGSVASAMVNMTQPVMMTFPYLSQFLGTAGSAKHLLGAVKSIATRRPMEKSLADAVKQAEKAGHISPQEIHHLIGEANPGFGGNHTLRRALFGWGRLFSLAEEFNRRVTFVAAYKGAVEKKMADPYAFAIEAIEATQGIYNKGNRPNWARNPVGATVLTFKQYSIAYGEFLIRLPKKERLLALAVLVLVAGAEGLPGADDLDDLIDTLLQSLGINKMAKEYRHQALEELLGKGAADVVLKGLSGTGIPIDVSRRLGMANLVPGTGILLKGRGDKSREVAEILGVSGSAAQDIFKGLGMALSGDPVDGARQVFPKAFKDLDKGISMVDQGFYPDSRGRRQVDTQPSDAAWKAIGFQPAIVAEASEIRRTRENRIAFARETESRIADDWAKGIMDKDQAAIDAARAEVIEWNKTNPHSIMKISLPQIASRIKNAKLDAAARQHARTPKEMRGAL